MAKIPLVRFVAQGGSLAGISVKPPDLGKSGEGSAKPMTL